MKNKPFTISFRYYWQDSLVEVRKTLWLPRRPPLSRVLLLCDSLIGSGVCCSYSVVSGEHDWDGLIDPRSWRVTPLPLKLIRH